MRALDVPLQRDHDRMIVMDIRSAELTKYAANTMLANRNSDDRIRCFKTFISTQT